MRCVPFFRDVVAHKNLVDRLVSYHREERIPHALLFDGEEGSEALPLAMAYARYLHCQSPKEGEACGSCPSCRQIDTLSHPDVHCLFPVAKHEKREVADDFLDQYRALLAEQSRPTLEDWTAHLSLGNTQLRIAERESDLLAKKLAYKSYQSKYRIVLVWHPERMHPACSNKILKLLEEPPPHVLFLMVTSLSSEILPTILSRLQRILVRPIPAEEMSLYVGSHYTLREEEHRRLVHLAQGNLRRLETLLAQEGLHAEVFSKGLELLELPLRIEPIQIKKVSEELHQWPRERLTYLLDVMMELLREMNAIKHIGPEYSYLESKDRSLVSSIAGNIGQDAYPKLMTELIKARQELVQNVSAKMIFMDLILLFASIYRGR